MTMFLTTDDVAALTRTAPATVRYWRWAGKGPRFTKLPGSSRVLYRREDVEAWIAGGSSGGHDPSSEAVA